VGRAADVPDELGDHSVRGAAEGQRAIRRIASRVDHHGQIDVVELTETHQLGLADQELQAALRPEPEPILDLDVLLGRNGEEGETARQLGEGAGVEERHADAEGHGHVAVVAARVGRPRVGIAVRVARGPDRVEFPDDGQGGAGPARVEHRLHARHGQTVPVRHAEVVERAPDQGRRLVLAVPQLGVCQDGSGQAHELIPARLDRLGHPSFRALAHHGSAAAPAGVTGRAASRPSG